MRSSGLEPPRGNLPTRPSTLRVYQFRHERRVREYSPAASRRNARDGGVPPAASTVRAALTLREAAALARRRAHTPCVRPGGALQCEQVFVPAHDPSPRQQGAEEPWI